MSLLGLASVLFCVLVSGVRYWDGSYFASGPPEISSFEAKSFGHCFPILVGAWELYTYIIINYNIILY